MHTFFTLSFADVAVANAGGAPAAPQYQATATPPFTPNATVGAPFQIIEAKLFAFASAATYNAASAAVGAPAAIFSFFGVPAAKSQEEAPLYQASLASVVNASAAPFFTSR